MQLTPSTVTRLIEKMEHKGLLTRKPVGKFTEVYPTPTEKGEKLDKVIKESIVLNQPFLNLSRYSLS